jgi:hypothetical protein
MVMTSEWFSERYLSCRRLKPYQLLPMNKDGTLQIPPVQDIRHTSFFNKEVEEMLALYDYEAPSSAATVAERNAATEEILRLGIEQALLKTQTQATSITANNSVPIVGQLLPPPEIQTLLQDTD